MPTEENEDLPFGDYMFIANRTFVRKTDLSKNTASSLSPKAFEHMIVKIPTSRFLGGGLMLESVHFVRFGIEIQASDLTVLTDQRRSDCERLRAFERARQFPLPELASTDALKAMLPSLLGPNYEIFSNQPIVAPEIQRKEVCPFSTSRPDIVFFHRENFCVADTLLMGCVPMEIESDDSDNTEEQSTLLGFTGEDKRGGSNFSQLIAGVFLVLSDSGLKAINRGSFFNRAIVFGMHRDLSSKVVPVKLTVDFTNSQRNVEMGTESVDLTGFITLMKRLLENPELIAT